MFRNSGARGKGSRLRVTTSASGYEQVADWLRVRILAGDFDILGARFPSGPELAVETGVSQHTVQQAFRQLVGEGLLEAVPRRGMTVPARRLWLADFFARLPEGGEADKEAARVDAALPAAAKRHPAVSDARTERVHGSIVVRVTVESAEPDAALSVAAIAARAALGPLRVTAVSAAAKGAPDPSTG
jgi:DNA-binding transcriptional MocR family regulator